GWASMAWGCFKPDRPRWDASKGKPRKYEHPTGTRSRSFWLRVPAAVAQRVADRFGLALPPEVAADGDGSAGAFWRWWAQTLALPLVVTEGAKKAAALLSAGLPAAAGPGIWNPSARGALLPELAAVPLRGRPAWVLFDGSDRPDPDEPRAARRLGRLLERAGAAVLVGCCPGPHKGADDALRAGVPWKALAAALRPLTPEPVLPSLPPADLIAPGGRHLAGAVDRQALAAAPLLLIDAPMGAGKTRLAAELVAPYLAAGVPVIAPTHRTALGESQAEAVGLAWAAAPGTDARLQGLGLCWDSLRPSSGLAINPEEWSGPDGLGPVLLFDEIAQGVEHLLSGTGTAVAQHRPETMATATALLRSARAVIGMDAQLSAPALRLLETLTGHRATLLRSEAQPMAGRPVLVPQGLTARTAAEQGRSRVLELAKDRRRGFVFTTAQQDHAKGGAANLAALVRRHWPDVRILLIDSENPEEAEQLGRDPNGVAAAHDWIICSPSITSGLSIDAPGLFDEVVVIGAGGRLPAEHLAQAAGRVRDPVCPVRIYAPATAPQLRIGSGDTSPAALLRHLASSEAHLLADLVGAAEWESSASNESPWLRCWLELASLKNRQAGAYAVTVAGLLRREGWKVADPAGLASSPLTREAAADLEVIAAAATAAADAAVIAAEPLTDAEAADLGKRRRLSAEERAQLKRHRIAPRWGLRADPPTPEILEADRQGLARPLRFRWLLEQSDRRELATAHDRRRAAQLAPSGHAWAPDLVRELLSHKIDAAEVLNLPAWLEGAGEWIAATDARLLQLQTLATSHASSLRAVLGVSPGKRPSGTLRTLAGLIGCRLEARRHRCGDGGRVWSYRLAPEPLPAGVDPPQLAITWREQLREPRP
ncbi:MAG: plasmid replication protein, CyRepA1 family, partial [Cyanobacteriota bacterium]